MAARRRTADAHVKRLLGLLSPSDYKRLQPHLQRVPRGYRMLGVQRTGVSLAALALQRAGLIRYRRGVVTILNRRGLRQRESYGVSRREFDRLLGDPPRREVAPRSAHSRRV